MTPAHLRRAVLAAVVLDDLPASPTEDGVRVEVGGFLPWSDVAAVLAGWALQPEHPAARRRLLVAVDAVGTLANEGAAGLRDRVHVQAEPAFGSALHAGPTWVVEQVPGAALDLGLGISDLPVAPGPSPLPPLPALTEALAGGPGWPVLRAGLDRLAGHAAERLDRDRAEGRSLVLRPVGEADVVTLLASPVLRAHLASGDGTGMRALAVPVRSRGWFDVSRIDVAYTRAAWAASATLDRAFERPLLVTRDEVSSPRHIGDVVSGPLADPAGATRDRDVRHR